MILYLKHNEIDRARWDLCISRAVNSMVYGYSWYLDIVSPGWEALAEEDYSSVFPLTHRNRFGISYLYQPLFTQQLGLFTTGILSMERVTEFLRAIPPKFRFAEIHLNSFNRVDASLFTSVPRVNHELELVRPHEELQSRYSQNARRNIRKAAGSGLVVRRKADPDDLIALFRNNFGKKEGFLKYRDYVTIRTLMAEAIRRSAGILMAAGRDNGPPDAAAFFVRDGGRFIFLFSASDYKTRDNGAMFLLIDTFIREHSDRPSILDFEGGNDPGLARFYQGFGASNTSYPMVSFNRLSPAANSMLRLYKKLIR